MVPSLHWLLLLWGLQGLLAQDYEEDYEEEVVTPRKKNKQFSTNSISQNGKCKSKIIFLTFFHGALCFPDAQEKLFIISQKVPPQVKK